MSNPSPMRTIAFMSGKGGVGKTSLTAGVACALRRHGYKVLAVDLDPQNSLRLHLGMDVSDPAGLIREGVARESLFVSPSGVHFLPFGRADSQDLQAFTAMLQEHPDWLSGHLRGLEGIGFDFVCIDTPPGASPFLQQALHAAQHALVVVLADAASYATLGQTHDLIRQHTAERADFRGPHVLLNQVPLQGTLGHLVRSALVEDAEWRLVPSSVHRDPRMGQALARQTTVVDAAPESMVAMDIEYLVDWLLEETAR